VPERRGFARFSAEWWDHWTMPIPETGCHIWLGCVCKDGYGRLGDVPKGTPQLPHRKAYEQFVGPIPASMKVCHRCDTPSCVNPDHLFLGTQKDNLRDMFAKRRAKPRGKEWGDRKTQILALLAENPEISRAEIATALNLTYAYVGLICRQEGISVVRRTCSGKAWREGAA